MARFVRWARGLPLLLACSLCLAAEGTKPVANELPPFEQVESLVEKHLAGQKGYRQGDLLTQNMVAPLFEQIEAIGWTVEDQKEIIERVLSENAPLARRLGTTEGRKFMRQVATYPDAYGRLDRLQRLSDGDRILRRLVQGPDGHKLIEYMATSQGGRNLQKSLSATPRGADFDKPTKRIYTSKDLLASLKQSHANAQESPGKRRSADKK